MKEIRELDRATLTTEQKLGLLLCANLYFDDDIDVNDFPKFAMNQK